MGPKKQLKYILAGWPQTEPETGNRTGFGGTIRKTGFAENRFGQKPVWSKTGFKQNRFQPKPVFAIGANRFQCIFDENTKTAMARATGRPRSSRDVHSAANCAAHLFKLSVHMPEYTQIYKNVRKYTQIYTNIYKYDTFQTILKTLGSLFYSKICLITLFVPRLV